ncbi:MAG: transposase [Patescibacteria group bacterium]
MPQRHPQQQGTFHLTITSQQRSAWCTLPGIPEILIDNLCMTRNLHKAELLSFCILPDHMHIIMQMGEKGLSAFVHSFKRNSSKDVRYAAIGECDRFDAGGARSAGNRTRAAGHPHFVDNQNRSRGSVTAATAQEQANAEFTGWQRGFHDEWIRDEKQFIAAFQYVEENALKHELVENLEDWKWSSLHFPRLIDREIF